MGKSYRRRPKKAWNGSDRADAGELLAAAVVAGRAADRATAQRCIGRVVEMDRPSVAVEVARQAEDAVARVWERGWQPADLFRLAGRHLSKQASALCRLAIAAESASYGRFGRTVAPTWMAQLSEMGAVDDMEFGRPWPLRVDVAWPDLLVAAIDLLVMIETIPGVPTLMPPPSRWPYTDGEAPRPRLDPALLARIRSLLAKAESTTFEAEAEALTAKAQELMTRHRIDRVTLDDGAMAGDGRVLGRRVGIDDPYARSKAVLLAGIAAANECRAVWSKEFGFATVFGLPEDLDGIEELFTSLLVQATVALQREGAKHDIYGRSRTTRFRRSFLVAFAGRIATRLRDAADDTVRAVEGETGASLAPVLASRARAAEKAVEETYPDLGQVQVSATDLEGYRAGTRLADQADLSTGPGSGPTPALPA